MAVRFKTTFKNALNELYTIHIHDADFAGAETLYVASGEGFELTQDGDGDNLYSPIIYTSAMIFMHVQDVNRTEIEDFIADIVDSQDENRFTVVIYDGSGQVFFRGKVQFERILIPDRHFNQITINASDGFGRLRSIPYSDNGTLYEGWETVRGHLFNVLSKLNLFGYGNYTTNSTAYATKITYDNVTSNAFNELRFQHDAMKEIKTDGTVLPFSCHDVLTQILTRFGCRIVQKAGVFHIQELTAIAEAGPMDVYFYDKDGDFDRVYPYSYNTAIIQKLAGGQAWFREPAKSVRLDYEYRDAVGGSNLSQEIIPWKTWKNIGMVPAGNGERVAFNFDFSVEHQAGGTATMYYITYEFAIRTGTYWLSNAGGVVQWINGDNTARYKVTNMFEIDDGIAINLIHEVSFIIPELPFTGDLNVYWDWAKTRSNGAALITPPTGIDTITNLQNVIVLLYSTTEFDINEGTIVTLATGSTTSGEQVELGTVVIGDLPFLRSIGRIQRYVALGQWENTSLKWGHGGSELLSLTHLVTREILSLRRKNTKVIAYVIRSPYAGAANKILNNVVTRASYRANSGIWDIETFVPVIDRAGIAWSDYVETDQIGGAPGGITLPPPPAGTFIGLNDTPLSYAGQAGKTVQVNSGETGLEWGSGGGGSDHPRAHQIDSIEDHPPVPINKRDKWVHTNADTGAVELVEQSPQGDPGITPHIGTNGNWWIGTTDTGVKAQGEDGEDGLTPYIGINGNWWIGTTDTGVMAEGVPGDSAYVYIAYASDASGTDFTLTFDADLDYIAVLSTTTEIVTPVVTDFAGLWKNYKGAPGADGVDGSNGTDGADAYLYIAYASDDMGTDFSLSPGATLTYIAALTTDTEIVTPQASDFTGLWRKYVGEDGTPADLTHYCYIAWRDAPGDGFTLTPNLSAAYEAILITHTELTSPVEADFDGYWRERLTIRVIHEVPAGGTTGQVIKKQSNDDFDIDWEDDNGGGSGGSTELVAIPPIDKTASGITTHFTANENQAFGDIVRINSTGKAQLAKADVIANATALAMCISATIEADATGEYLLLGFVRDDSWDWTIGEWIYLSLTGTTGNTLTQVSPFTADPIVEDTVVQMVGVANTADTFYFNPQLVQVELKP